MSRTTSGFTIVELLIVIVVIAILATISVVAYNGIRFRAQASAIVSELKATEKAFNAYKVSTGSSSWWLDSDAALTGSGNPAISDIILSKPEFRNYLQKSPTTDGLGTGSGWIYDNDGDTYSGCNMYTAGVSLGIIGPTNLALLQEIDRIADDGNLNCGKVRYGSGWFLYGLANDPAS